MKKIEITTIIVTCFFITACGGMESDARKAVLDSLKDPDSAKFGKFTQVNDKSACLTVNARNSMGGYAGDQQASLIKKENAWVVLNIDDRSHEMCIDIMKGISDARVPASEQVEKTAAEVVEAVKAAAEAAQAEADANSK
jgi:hypothetical protein